MTERKEWTPPCHAACSTCAFSTLFPVFTYLLLPAGVIALVKLGEAYLLLFLGQLLLAIGAVEWSWLAFRICQRLLLAAKLHEDSLTTFSADRAAAIQEDPTHLTLQTHTQHASDEEARRLRALEDQSLRREVPGDSYINLLNETIRPKSFAIAPLTDKICSGRWYLAAFFLATVGAAVSVALGYAMEYRVFDSSNPTSGWKMMVGASAEAAFVSIFCGSLAPTGADAVVLVVYQACVLAASMNAYLKLQLNVIASIAQVDPLFTILAGAIIIILFRVVTSKVVMHSLLLVLCDVLGLVCIVAPLIAFADLIDQAMSQSFKNQLALFLLVVLAADVGDCLAKYLQLHRPQALNCCHRIEFKTEASSYEVEALAISLTCGAIMIAADWLGMGGADLTIIEVVVLFCSIALGQWCRLWMAHIRQMAKVSTSAFYFPEGSRTCGVLDRMTVFLVAIIVYYPYIKQKYFS